MTHVPDRAFGLADQLAFAALSGDGNPLHVDPVAARRLLFGAAVVHGMHLALWALDGWLGATRRPGSLRLLRAQFRRPVPVGESATLIFAESAEGRAEVAVNCGGIQAAALVFEWDASAAIAVDGLADANPPRKSPRVVPEDRLARESGVLPLGVDAESLAALFPNLAAYMPRAQVALLLGTTRLVGVECPGLHSVFSGLQLESDAASRRPELRYAVEDYDARFRRASIAVAGAGLSGKVLAFVRPGPRLQAGCVELRRQLKDGEFAAQRALVIGGSRGLGEVVAKLLGAGGAQVSLSYCRGQEDARRVVDDIATAGGVARAFRFDVLDPAADVLAASGGPAPTHLYYFATPPIGASAGDGFAPEMFARFCAYYVTGLARVP